MVFYVSAKSKTIKKIQNLNILQFQSANCGIFCNYPPLLYKIHNLCLISIARSLFVLECLLARFTHAVVYLNNKNSIHKYILCSWKHKYVTRIWHTSTPPLLPNVPPPFFFESSLTSHVCKCKQSNAKCFNIKTRITSSIVLKPSPKPLLRFY